jgi:hypothetical protein
MNQIKYMTLADARRVDAAKFDDAIKLAFKEAASDVGERIVIQALCTPQHAKGAEILRAA